MSVQSDGLLVLRRGIRYAKRRAWEPVFLGFNHFVERKLGGVAAPPSLTAKAVCVIRRETLEPVLVKNARIRFPPASLTKLATSLVFARHSAGRWDERVRIDPGDVAGGSTMGLAAGEEVSRRDLLYGMLLPSGNDAALAAARLIGPTTIERMNALARELGMRRTTFVNPHGKDEAGQASCARDLALLAGAAFADPSIAEAAASRSRMINGREIVSTVELLGVDGVGCGKTGSTRWAGGCLALGYREYVLCLIGSDLAFDAGGYPVATTDRRYEDARRIMRALDRIE